MWTGVSVTADEQMGLLDKKSYIANGVTDKGDKVQDTRISALVHVFARKFCQEPAQQKLFGRYSLKQLE